MRSEKVTVTEIKTEIDTELMDARILETRYAYKTKDKLMSKYAEVTFYHTCKIKRDIISSHRKLSAEDLKVAADVPKNAHKSPDNRNEINERARFILLMGMGFID